MYKQALIVCIKGVYWLPPFIDLYPEGKKLQNTLYSKVTQIKLCSSTYTCIIDNEVVYSHGIVFKNTYWFTILNDNNL